jgi:flagellar protein FliO/FliZ
VLELALRLVFSLAVVVGLMLLLARLAAKRNHGRHGDLVRVLHRQPLTRGTSVSVVAVGSRVLVLGTSEQQVRVLTELDPEEVALPVTAPEPVARPVGQPVAGAHRADAPTLVATRSDGALAGSVLSAATWRQALAAATRRAS